MKKWQLAPGCARIGRRGDSKDDSTRKKRTSKPQKTASRPKKDASRPKKNDATQKKRTSKPKKNARLNPPKNACPILLLKQKVPYALYYDCMGSKLS